MRKFPPLFVQHNSDVPERDADTPVRTPHEAAKAPLHAHPFSREAAPRFTPHGAPPDPFANASASSFAEKSAPLVANANSLLNNPRRGVLTSYSLSCSCSISRGLTVQSKSTSKTKSKRGCVLQQAASGSAALVAEDGRRRARNVGPTIRRPVPFVAVRPRELGGRVLLRTIPPPSPSCRPTGRRLHICPPPSPEFSHTLGRRRANSASDAQSPAVSADASLPNPATVAATPDPCAAKASIKSQRLPRPPQPLPRSARPVTGQEHRMPAMERRVPALHNRMPASPFRLPGSSGRLPAIPQKVEALPHRLTVLPQNLTALPQIPRAFSSHIPLSPCLLSIFKRPPLPHQTKPNPNG